MGISMHSNAVQPLCHLITAREKPTPNCTEAKKCQISLALTGTFRPTFITIATYQRQGHSFGVFRIKQTMALASALAVWNQLQTRAGATRAARAAAQCFHRW